MRATWHASTTDRRRRSQIDPNARQGHLDVSLSWLYKHCKGLYFAVRWWEGPTDTQGAWKYQEFDGGALLRNVKDYARKVAENTTQWEVEVTLRGRTHGNLGWEYGTIVWEYGHYLRDA